MARKVDRSASGGWRLSEAKPQISNTGASLRSATSHPILFALVACLFVGADQPTDEAADVPSPRQRIEQMSASEREQLGREERTFAAMTPAEQDRLRELHERLDAEPELRRVMVEYHEWLKTLQPLERAELLSMEPAQRVEQIRKLKQQQEAQSIRRMAGLQLADNDLQAIFRWLDDLAVAHQDQILAEVPQERRDQIEGLPPLRRRQQLAMAAAARMQMNTPVGRRLIDDADFAKLREKLSPDAQARLDKAQTKPQKLELLQDAMLARRAAQERRRLPQINEQELEKFFASELTAQERDRLLEMPREDMQRELRRIYAQRKGLLDRPNRPDRAPGGPGGPTPRGGGRGPKPMPEGT